MRQNNWFCGRCLRTVLALLSLLFFCAAAPADKYFQTPVQKKDLDPDATSQKIEGQPAEDVHFHPRHNHPGWVVWTRSSGPGHSGVKFGISDSAGVRHLRLGFKREIPVGTIFARGGGQLSILKPEAPYPGDPGQENHWQKATRVHEGEYSLWILPPNTATRALRFSQESRGRMKVKFQGHLSGVYILKERLINLAPEADIIASTNQKKARFLNDHSRGGWHGVWENEWQERSKTISDKSPESLMLLWPTEVELRGLCALWAGFSRVQVACYKGPEKIHPREAEAEHWQNLGDFKVDHQYPRRFAPNWLDFGKTIKTRAVRLTLTEPSPSEQVHPHVVRKPRGGKRAWLGELMAVHAIQNEDAVIPEKLRRAAESDHPPIPIEFTLKEPGYVTLVIENSEGKRVRNLLSSRRFEAGQHTVWWDGLDETPVNSRVHGIYDIRGRLVEPGQYRVRGLYRGDVKLRYQMTPYSSGDPPWLTPDHKGGWLADHTPPWDALFVPEGPSGKPEVLLTSYVVEHGHGLIGVDLNGKKLWGIRRLGGVWTGGSHLAADRGAKADPEVIAYIGSWWSSRDGKGEVRLTALDKDCNQRTILKYETKNKKIARLGGLAVHNGILVASLPELKTLLFVDASSGKTLHAQTIENPGSIAFDAAGRLLMIQADKIRRYSLDRSVPRPGKAETVPAQGLKDPRRLSIAENGRLYVSDWGKSHQVKIFSPEGKLLRKIGTPGGRQVGKYDPTRMHLPAGTAVDSRGRLWVAERDKTPKRVSLWSENGEFIRAFYGPPKYGGGGALDPADKTRFYYAAGGDFSGLGFRLDWKRRTFDLTDIYYRASETETRIPCGHHSTPVAPQRAIHHRGHHYMTNAFNSNPTTSPSIVGVWLVRENTARPVAAVGSARRWEILKEDRFKDRLPEGFDWKDRGKSRKLLFAWSDLNLDHQLQPDEVTFRVLESPSVGQGYIRRDLTMMFTFTDRLSPTKFTDAGVPVYDASKAERAVAGKIPTGFTSGARVAIDAPDGWIIRTGGPIRGYRNGTLKWAYPNRWPGLHASHNSPTPQHAGQIIGATRILGHPVEPADGEAGPIWAINGNFGNVYLMTVDGLFVKTLGRDQRSAPPWHLLEAKPGMVVEDVSFITEHFWPTIVKSEGEIYLTAGKGHCSILRVDGLESVRSLPEQRVSVTPEHLAEASAYRRRVEKQRIQRRGRKTLTVRMADEPPEVDGKLGDWAGAEWVRIGEYKRRIKELKADAALAVAGDRLFAAFRTGSAKLLQNTGESWKSLFKTGGALDLKLATDPTADPERKDPVGGDLRLLITEVGGKTKAVLYRPVDPEAPADEAVPFSSPWRTVTFDSVRNVSDSVELAGRDGNFEVSVSLDVLGLKPRDGLVIAGDIGILRGSRGVTIHRLYWHNKSTGIISDVPGEAALRPDLWGRWRFEVD